MRLEQEASKAALNRLKRARGQLDAVIRMLEAAEECEKVVTQLAACSKAIDKAGYQLIAAGLRECIASGEDTAALEERLERVFMSFS